MMRLSGTILTAAAVLGSWGTAALGDPAFVEVTPAVGINWTVSSGQAFAGLSETDGRMQRNMGNGAAVGDYDGDGDLDVYMLGQLGESNSLYRNDPGGTFTNVTGFAGVDNLGLSRVAHFADLDNDGDLDLILVNDNDSQASYVPSKIFKNEGDGTFTDVTAGSNFTPLGFLLCGAAVADYDQDGLLDIYITGWFYSVAYPGSNRLYRNLGNFIFSDVTEQVGIGVIRDPSFTPVLVDFNGDHFPEIYTAVDYTFDEFLWNNSGVFTDATFEVGVTSGAGDMGSAVVDFDNDGDLDIYNTNITHPTFGGGFMLYVNKYDQFGQTIFLDETQARGAENLYWGWGVEFTDVENDGDLDIFSVNGFDEHILALGGGENELYQTPSVLLLNDGTGHFSRNFAPGLEGPKDSRALIAFDFDRDGDEDLLITNVGQPSQLLENVTDPRGHWFGVSVLQGPGMNRNGIGATIYATVGGTTYRRDIIGGESYLSGTPLEVHFGLGDATLIDDLRIAWTDGSESIFTGVAVDRFVRISQVLGDCNADASLDSEDIPGFVALVVGNESAPLCGADMNNDGLVDGRDISPFVVVLLGL